MAEQSRLEKQGFDSRAGKEFISRHYQNENNKEYNGNHKDAMSDGDPQGKGTGVSMGYAVRDLTAPKTQMNYHNMDTTKGGGKYDIEGAKGVIGAFQGDAGRESLMHMNIYSPGPDSEYGLNSVDTLKNQLAGQIVIR